jgi:catechol 2,3-dioxygenase-like lactoylglutathione lyase family enzyme
MLKRVDRIVMRVTNVGAGVRYYRDAMGLELVKEDQRVALLRFGDGVELVLHSDPDLPAEAVYYLVDDVRKLFERRVELKLTFVQPPAPVARGHRAAIRDPFGNVMLIVDRSAEAAAAVVEDGKAPGMLFSGVAEKGEVDRELLVEQYVQIGRTADDLPYTPDFEKLYAVVAGKSRSAIKPTRGEVWTTLLNIRKGKKLPKLGEARSKPPEVSAEEKELLRGMIGEEMGRRDRLPYTEKFDRIVDEFNKTQNRPLSPHLVWRLVATLAK